MKKIIISAATIVMAATVANAQMSDLTNGTSSFQVVGAGARLGVGSLMQDGDDLTKSIGFNGAAEGVYTYYFARSNKSKPAFGVRTGLGFAFTQNGVLMDNYTTSYEVVDNEKNKVKYTVNAVNLEEKNRQLSLEVPVMCAMLYRQIYANLGVKVGVPLMSKYTLTMENPSIQADFLDYGVTVKDEKVLGVVSAEQTNQTEKLDAASFNLSLALEGGYILPLGGNWLSIGLYVDYGIVNNYDGGEGRIIDVDMSTINSSNNMPATVTVESMTKSTANKLGNFDVGIKAVYSWPMMKTSKR